MALKKNLASILLALTLSSGCASYKINTPDYIHPKDYLTCDSSIAQRREMAKQHYLYKIIPLSRDQLKWYDFPRRVSYNLFGNEDDGIFGEYCKKPYSKDIDTSTFLRWYIRNPAHNFCFYALGFQEPNKKPTKNSFAILRADEKFLFLSKDEDPCVMGDTPASFNLSLNHYLPFLSFRFPVYPERKFDFYFGWRPSGAFGIKLRPFSKDGGW
jgi:hypothetical protein